MGFANKKPNHPDGIPSKTFGLAIKKSPLNSRWSKLWLMQIHKFKNHQTVSELLYMVPHFR